MNVPNKFVTKVQFVKTPQGHLNVFVRNKLLAIHTHHPDAYCQINAIEMKIVPRIWPVSKENVPNHVISLNVDPMQSAKPTNIRPFVNVHREILEIQLIKLLDASELNVSAVRIAVKINTAIHRSINVKVSIYLTAVIFFFFFHSKILKSLSILN